MQYPPQPTIFLNILSFDGKHIGQTEVLTSRADAVRDAEDWSERYEYTFTNLGVIDLRPEFSEKYKAAVAHDQHVDARIDEMREGRA
jgi:hypothetical protein